MAELVCAKRALLASLGVAQKRGRYPVSAEAQLRAHARGAGWPAPQLASAQQQLQLLLARMAAERARLRAFAQQDPTLDLYNVWLAGYGLPEAASLTAARAALGSLYVSLYDLVAGSFRTFPSLSALRRHIQHNELYFKKSDVKSTGMKAFLRKILF